METRSIDWVIAFLGGLILTLMIDSNSLLAKYSSPLFASWVAYGVGALVAFFLVMLAPVVFRSKNKVTESITIENKKIPLWIYLGGIPGAMTVVLSAITVNSTLALAGSFALMLLGQIVFGMFSDIFGWFGTPKKEFVFIDFVVILLILAGSSLIIFFR